MLVPKQESEAVTLLEDALQQSQEDGVPTGDLQRNLEVAKAKVRKLHEGSLLHRLTDLSGTRRQIVQRFCQPDSGVESTIIVHQVYNHEHSV